MKYRVWLKILHFLVYVKRFFWWIGTGLNLVLVKAIGAVAGIIIYFRYKLQYLFRHLGIVTTRDWFLKRSFLQATIFILLVAFSIGQSNFLGKRDLAFASQKTIAYTFFNQEPDVGQQEVVSAVAPIQSEQATWQSGVAGAASLPTNEGNQTLIQTPILGTVIAGGLAVTGPIVMSGATLPTPAARNTVTTYTVESGDSLGSIAESFGVSVSTIMWANSLTLNSTLHPGDVLKILPVTGVIYTIKKGDSLNKIATTFQAQPADIIAFNHLNAGGTNLIAGEDIIIPNGTEPNSRGLAASTARITTVARSIAAPPPSTRAPSASGFVWPTAAHTITQYYGVTHHAIDIAGPWQTPNYAAKAGVVEVSQCGWNSGYGCYIIINHGNGVKTLYAHNSVLLVKPGDHVVAGQTISLMGNTGNVRGTTGIHLHFEIQINGVRVNPLAYVH